MNEITVDTPKIFSPEALGTRPYSEQYIEQRVRYLSEKINKVIEASEPDSWPVKVFLEIPSLWPVGLAEFTDSDDWKAISRLLPSIKDAGWRVTVSLELKDNTLNPRQVCLNLWKPQGLL